ncbi:MAG: glycoside hydrolase family 3 N-terminal domain-containing protein [Chloroherpetonaceae bacterium]|nr:glycoside hydrolase family 3 N-terminal domain-containing protein [Chloroherpetonaceae bacterium]
MLAWLIVLSSCVARAQKPALDSLEFKIGQMVMVGFRGLSVADTSAIVQDLRQRYIGGVILFDYDVPAKSPVRNIESPAQVRQLIHRLKQIAAEHSTLPLFVAIDQEGGRVARLKEKFGFQRTVSAAYLGTQPLDSTRFYAARIAKELASLGININFAPCVNVNLNPENPVIAKYERSFSADARQVARYAEAFIDEHRKQGILTTLKHFPGHGSSRSDSHVGFVDVTAVWSPEELMPYRTLIQAGKVDMVMTAHIFHSGLDSALPATLSQNVVKRLLRDSLQYKGVVVSDDMQMKAISAQYGLETAIKYALLAGIDMLLFGNNLDYDPEIARKATACIKQLVADKVISPARIEESYQRIVALKLRLQSEPREAKR